MIFIEFENGSEYSIDATLSFSTPLESESTEYTVEDGSPVSDHISNMQQTIEIRGFMSDTPLDATGAYSPSENGRHLEFLDAIQTAWQNKELLIIDAENRDVWERMQIVSFSPEWSTGQGNSYNFTLSLKQIEFTTAQKSRALPTATDRQSNARFSPQRSVGAVSPINATTEQNTLVQSAGSYPGVPQGADFVAGA